jgi:hypothetical protein
MEFKIGYSISLYPSIFDEGCGGSVTVEHDNQEDAITEMLTLMVENEWPIPPTMEVESYKTIVLQTPDGLETFESEPRIIKTMNRSEIILHPTYILRKNYRVAQTEAKKRAKEEAEAEIKYQERLKIYREVKAEMEAGMAETQEIPKLRT